ncbi:MAG: carboxypeptidase regulatory-like domain-containing protein, partial [Phycisphaerales bacterium]|nr:carboxypeptidase regulatory-like domain-containing protein [Phycisphaerales bacterium]
MTRWIVVCGVLLTGCSGNGSPVTPGPSTVALTGSVTATNSGQPLAGAQIDAGGRSTVTDGMGRFTLPEAPMGRLSLMISGAGLIPHVLPIDAQQAIPLALDAIAEGSGFDLAFYRQFVRNGYEAPTKLEPLRRWTVAPSFDIQTTDDTGATVDPTLLANVRAAIIAVTPIWTGGQFSATFGPGITVRFLATLDGTCARS